LLCNFLISGRKMIAEVCKRINHLFTNILRIIGQFRCCKLMTFWPSKNKRVVFFFNLWWLNRVNYICFHLNRNGRSMLISTLFKCSDWLPTFAQKSKYIFIVWNCLRAIFCNSTGCIGRKYLILWKGNDECFANWSITFCPNFLCSSFIQ